MFIRARADMWHHLNQPNMHQPIILIMYLFQEIHNVFINTTQNKSKYTFRISYIATFQNFERECVYKLLT